MITYLIDLHNDECSPIRSLSENCLDLIMVKLKNLTKGLFPPKHTTNQTNEIPKSQSKMARSSF